MQRRSSFLQLPIVADSIAFSTTRQSVPTTSLFPSHATPARSPETKHWRCNRLASMRIVMQRIYIAAELICRYHHPIRPILQAVCSEFLFLETYSRRRHQIVVVVRAW